MLSLYRAWLGPSPCVARPAPPPDAHRPVPRRARLQTPPNSPRPLNSPTTPPPPSPSSTSTELDVENVTEDLQETKSTVLDIASCDGPVKFSRVLNAAWKDTPDSWPCRHKKKSSSIQYFPCKTCGSKFPSYYFVHKHRKQCHADEVDVPVIKCQSEPSTSMTIK